MAFLRNRIFSSSSSKLRPLFFSLIVALSLLIIIFTASFKSICFFNSCSKLETKLLAETIDSPRWFEMIAKAHAGRTLKIGLVNVNENEIYPHQSARLPDTETVTVPLEIVDEGIKWREHLFPRTRSFECPKIPMPPSNDSYHNLDVVVAMAPCGAGDDGEGVWPKDGVRDVFRLQVNLVVANLTVSSGWAKPDVHRTVYVVFIGSCEPMREIFRCDDLVMHGEDYRVYKPHLGKLAHKLHMPVGSCQVAHVLEERDIEVSKQLHFTVHDQREAYATVLHSSEAYVCGAIALAKSIKLTGSTKDLVLLADDSVSPKSIRGLENAGWIIKRIQPIRNPYASRGTYNEWNYSKLRTWQLTEYEKVIFIDADILVLKNMDKFFSLPQLSAAPNDRWIFNSGIMVLEPSLCTFEELMRESFRLKSYNGGDQGFLNEFFTWWHKLSVQTNRFKIFNSDWNEKRELPTGYYTIHYFGWKPWMCYRDYDCNWDMEIFRVYASDWAHSIWWSVYDALPNNLQQYCALTKSNEEKIRRWREIAKSDDFPDRHWNRSINDPRRLNLVS